MRPRRVSILTFDFGESVVPLASALSRDLSVQLLIPEAELEPFYDELDPAIEVSSFVKPRLRQPLRQLRTMRRLYGDLRRFSPDVIHLQQGHLWFNWLLYLLKEFPLVVTVHDARPHVGDRGGKRTPQFVMDIPYRRAHRIITHAAAVKGQLMEEWGIQESLIDVTPLAFPTRPAAPEEDRPLSPTVLFFGRIWPYKGLDYLIAAEPHVSLFVPGVKFVIAGVGEDFERYAAMMVHPERFAVENTYISVARREELLAQASLVVLPYIEATQTGVVPLAFRHSKPVVATAVGGLPEVVQDGVTGFVVPPRDAKALASAIVRLLVETGLLRTMSRNARAGFESVFAAPAIARKTLDIYESVGPAASSRRGVVRKRGRLVRRRRGRS